MSINLKLTIEILQSLGRLEQGFTRLETKVAKIDDDLKALTDVVTRTSTDVKAILAQVAAGGVTPAQLGLIEAATTALSAQDDALEAVLTPSPTPTATAASKLPPGSPAPPKH